jgi:hypothetical protein
MIYIRFSLSLEPIMCCRSTIGAPPYTVAQPSLVLGLDLQRPSLGHRHQGLSVSVRLTASTANLRDMDNKLVVVVVV